MRIVMMNGGLANQTLQYIFARYLEESTGEQVLIDDTYFFRTQQLVDRNKEKQDACNLSGVHNGYELEYVFPAAPKPLLMSQNLTTDVLKYMAKKTYEHIYQALEADVPLQLIGNGMEDLIVVFENISQKAISAYTGKKFFVNPYEFNPDVAKIEGNVYFSGYWVTAGWLNAYRETLLNDLTFRPLTDSTNKHYEQEVRNNFSIGVHIRRGDFVKYGWATPERNFKEALDNLKDKVPGNARYFIFSDHLDWCKENMVALGIPRNAIFVEGNFDYQNNYIDMMLMSKCSILVFGASSFSFLASLLNQRDGFKSIQIDDLYWVNSAQRR